MRKHLSQCPAALLLLCGALSGVGLLGCRDFVEDRCELVCDCMECSDEQQATCEVETEAVLDVADAYDCSDDMETYLECETEKYRCFDQNYQIGSACNQELASLFDCMDETSKRPGGAFSPPTVSRP